MKQALLIFVKNLIEGKVKTRLAASIGDASALSIYRAMLVHTESCTRNLSVDKTVFYSDHQEANDIWTDSVYMKHVQTGNNLGERMQNAFDHAFAQGYEQVAIIGSDCFELTDEILETAFSSLNQNDVVLGPATDGGYYLLALKVLHQELFNDIDWSTNQVLRQTMLACRELGLKTFQLPELSDIDNETDLKRAGYLK